MSDTYQRAQMETVRSWAQATTQAIYNSDLDTTEISILNWVGDGQDMLDSSDLLDGARLYLQKRSQGSIEKFTLLEL